MKAKALLNGIVFLYFVMGLEILIMISPFAAFFYAAFNPFLLTLVQYPSTRWLTAFFLPHMVLPPGLFLKVVRVSGSILFVAGTLVFFICAGQVYYNKIFKKGVVLHGLYSYIRHPQYLGLALTGLGLSILWPRFLVITLWVLMLSLYYILAKDEERRMLAQFGSLYADYMERTGMFLPRIARGASARAAARHSSAARAALALVLVAVLAIGGAFALRSYTVSRLPVWTNGPVTALAILPDDAAKLDHRMADILEIPEIKTRMERGKGPFLVYFMPKEYIMQGMIADTGGEWRLYKQHHAVAMITDWIFHPFRHLEGGHAMMRLDMMQGMHGNGAGGGMVRRLIFLSIETEGGRTGLPELFGINARSVPLFVADVEIHNLILMDIKDLPVKTGWGQVPTPTF